MSGRVARDAKLRQQVLRADDRNGAGAFALPPPDNTICRDGTGAGGSDAAAGAAAAARDDWRGRGRVQGGRDGPEGAAGEGEQRDGGVVSFLALGPTDLSFANDPSKPPDRAIVGPACQVIEVLGGDYRKHIIERYIQLQLQDYRRIFRSTDEAGQLDNVPRRYAWFRRVLKSHDEESGSLFPDSWEVSRLLVASFADSTRADLTNVLLKTPPSVTVLLDALQATLDFEATYARRFGCSFEDITDRLDALNAPQQRFTISSAFDAHFGIFVDAQDKAIADTLGPHRGMRSRASFEGVSNDDEGATALVLPSSMELFHVYRAALDKCSQYTTGEPLQRLARVFAKWLKVYSDDVLLASMKKPAPADFLARRSVEGRSDLAEVRNTCMVLNTAEYCLNTSVQLEDLVKEKIKPELADSISFQDERDGFNGAIAQCLSLIMKELENAVEPSFAAMLRTPWKDLENVSGRSAYIVDLVGSVKEIAAVVGTRTASPKYVRNFSDKCVNLIMGRFTSAIVRSRPLKKIGAEQLLLDISAVKGCLLELPPLEQGEKSHQHKKYVAKVTKATGELETMLKVILAPDEVPEGFVQNYCLLIGDRSFSNFQKILDLKGTLKGEQLQKLLDIFLAVTRTKDDLEDSSFLTKLDMDEKTTTGPTVGGGLFSSGNTTPTLGLGSKAPDRTETPKAFGDFRKFFRRDTHS